MIQIKSMHHVWCVFIHEGNDEGYTPIFFEGYQPKLKYAKEVANDIYKEYKTDRNMDLHICDIKDFDNDCHAKYIHDYQGIIIEKMNKVYLIFIYSLSIYIDPYCYLAAISDTLGTAELIAEQIDSYMESNDKFYDSHYGNDRIINNNRYNLGLDIMWIGVSDIGRCRKRLPPGYKHFDHAPRCCRFPGSMYIQQMPIIEHIDQFQLDTELLDAKPTY